VWLLDLHEALDRVCERFIEPQCEIIAYHKRILGTRCEMLALNPQRDPIERLELDDALQAVVLATAKYARDQFGATRQHFESSLKALPRRK